MLQLDFSKFILENNENHIGQKIGSSQTTKFHCGLVIDAVIILALVEKMELIDTLIMYVFAIYTFSKLAVAHDILVINAVIFLTKIEKMELIDAFIIHVFVIHTLKKHAESHDRLVMNTVIIPTFVEEIE